MATNDLNSLFAERLEALFQQKGYKADYVAFKVGISEAYLSRLRHGKAVNPGFNIIQALAEVFDVSPAYFFGEGDKDSPLIDDIALRAGDLDERGRKALNDMLAYIASLKVKDEPQEKADDTPL